MLRCMSKVMCYVLSGDTDTVGTGYNGEDVAFRTDPPLLLGKKMWELNRIGAINRTKREFVCLLLLRPVNLLNIFVFVETVETQTS